MNYKLPFIDLKRFIIESHIRESQQNVVGTFFVTIDGNEKKYPIFMNSKGYGLEMGEERYSSNWIDKNVDSVRIVGIPEFENSKLDVVINTLRPHVKFNIKNQSNGKFRTFEGFRGGSKVQSVGEGIEPIVCYAYNHTKNDRVKFPQNEMTDDWKLVVERIVDFINSPERWPNSNYVAAHVNGNDIGNIPRYAKDAAKLFYSKQEAERLLNLDNGTLNDLYIGVKDNWNKADIILVRKDFSLDDIGEIENAKEFNLRLKELTKNDILIPLSLKKLDLKSNNEIRLIPEGFGNSKTTNKVKKLARSVFVKFPKYLKPNTNDGTIYLNDNNRRTIKFRKKDNTDDSLSVEISLGSAHGGKGITKIKKLLDLSGTFWYLEPFSNEKEITRFLRINGFEYNQEDIDFLNEQDVLNPKWYNRTCFRGLVHLYRQYKAKFANATPEKFFDWIYKISSSGFGSPAGEGAFYLLMNH